MNRGYIVVLVLALLLNASRTLAFVTVLAIALHNLSLVRCIGILAFLRDIPKTFFVKGKSLAP
jgi:hypothetical protein